MTTDKCQRAFIFLLLELFVRFCHQCGHSLTPGVEKYCPECGTNLVISPPPSEEASTDSSKRGNDYYSSTNISGTHGDVVGVGVSGS
jgi:predicted RNA-binding Zn-ribbon protein involved in translation (DUF1610 family)